MTDAAVALFSEEGYAAVTTRRIAERAGCSETLLFRYFGDKHGLLLAVCNGLWEAGPATRSTLPEYQTVQEFLENFLISDFRDLKHIASPLKVVVAALINDPEMTADFAQRHEHAIETVAKELKRFQDMGAIDADVNTDSLAEGIEQLGFAIGFFVQIVFGRSEEQLTAMARSLASALSVGLQGSAQPMLEPRRRKAVAAVLGARDSLDEIIELLQDGDLASDTGARNGSSPAKV